MKNSGILYLVSTPIGNLKDITLRALEILKNVDQIIAESTDQIKKLLNHYQIEKTIIHLADENQLSQIPKIIEKLLYGKNLALVSDAGTPLISDPGQLLVQEAIKRGIKISPLPGPSAILPALILSSFPTSPFIFLGFLPKKKNEIKKLLQELTQLTINKKSPTFIAFESSHRLVETTTVFSETVNDNCQIVIAREMTKIYEEFIRGTPKEVLKILKARNNIKGEITIVFKLT